MKVISAEDIRAALPYDRLARDLPALLRQSVTAPPRPMFDLPDNASMLLMPAWSADLGGVKIVHVTPDNAGRGKEVVNASYLAFDAQTHEHIAIIDGNELTARRTAAVAAIAADRLARPDTRSLMIVGSGRIASELAFAYRAVRDIRDVRIISRNRDNAETLAEKLRTAGFDARACDSVEHDADIIACATLSHVPWVEGEKLGDNHVALIGGFTPDMREADDEAIRHATVYADTHDALTSAGDLCQPLARGVISGIDGVLSDLCTEGFPRPLGPTVFKSVGEATQDLAAVHILLNA